MLNKIQPLNSCRAGQYMIEFARGILRLLLPREKGSWSMILEPVCLAVFLYFKPDILLLAAIALSLFFSRRPLVSTLRFRENNSRIGTNIGLTLALSFLFLASGFTMIQISGWGILLYFLISLPFSLTFLAFDRVKKARHPVAEYAGAVGFSFVPATALALAGHTFSENLALMVFLALRTISAVADVRLKLRLLKTADKKRTSYSYWFVHIWALLVGFVLAFSGFLPGFLPWIMVFSSLRSFHLILSDQLATARAVGIDQMKTGIVFNVLVALAYYF